MIEWTFKGISEHENARHQSLVTGVFSFFPALDIASPPVVFVLDLPSKTITLHKQWLPYHSLHERYYKSLHIP
jgi:hypothetical protein